jgi:hypothetical protein
MGVFFNATATGGVGHSLTGLPQSKGNLKMKSYITMITLVGFSMFLVTPALADWDPSQPAKYVQMPDPNGMNVNATYIVDANQPTPAQPVFPWQKILADDFLCTQTGPITDIHIWGSWLGDKIPHSTTNPNLQNVAFKLSLHTDVPAGVDAPYSHPGQEVWSDIYTPGAYANRFWSNSNELFYEPNTNRIIGQDSQIWQYNFKIDPAKAFIQQGTAANPQIYWLDVQAIIQEPAPPAGTTLPPDFVFGWKTSLDGFTVPDPTGLKRDDDAVFGDTFVPGGLPYGQFPDFTGAPTLPWMEMIYPAGSPYAGHSINLAFAITTVPEPGTLVMLGCGLVSLLFYIRRKK